MTNTSGGDPTKLFVTEIPIDARPYEVLKALEPFGKIKSLTMVEDKSGENAYLGRAFVEYYDKESGEACLAKSRHSTKLVSEKLLLSDSVQVKGQPVVVRYQISKEEIIDKSRTKDPRNLALSYEGHITPDVEAAQGVPEAEMEKRKNLWEKKLQKLADVNNKVCDKRLAVFNIPEEIGTGRLRKIFAIAPMKYARKHKKDELAALIQKSPIRITEVRKPEGREDCAFLEFTKHEHALAALRQVNNNPTYFPDRRLIVEFAIENSFKTKERRKKIERKKNFKAKRFNDHAPNPQEQFSDDENN